MTIRKATSRKAESSNTSLAGLVEKIQRIVLSGKPALMQPANLSGGLGDRFSAEEISDLIVPKRTLARRISKHESLSADETDRAIRVARVSLAAERVFADAEKASRWLRKPNRALNDQRPIDLLRSEVGTQAVNELLGQIDHGMFV